MPTLSELQLLEMERQVRLWGKLRKTDALALLAAYRAAHPTTPAQPAHSGQPRAAAGGAEATRGT